MATAKPDIRIPWAEAGVVQKPDDARRLAGYVAEIPEYPEFNWILQNLGLWAKYSNERGIPEWDENTEYSSGSIVVDPVTGGLRQSVQNANQGNPLSDRAWWSADFVGGGIRWATRTANFNAEAGFGYLAAGAITATLPAEPTDGAEIDFADYSRAWGANGLVIVGNGKNINGAASYTARQQGGFLRLVFSSTANEWKLVTAWADSPHLGRNWNIRTNPQVIDEDLTMAATDNGSSVGPLTIQTGRVVTITPGATWSIL